MFVLLFVGCGLSDTEVELRYPKEGSEDCRLTWADDREDSILVMAVMNGFVFLSLDGGGSKGRGL